MNVENECNMWHFFAITESVKILRSLFQRESDSSFESFMINLQRAIE